MTSLSTATVVGAARDRAATARPPGRKRRLRRYVGVLFVLPATAYLVTFQLFPMLYGLYLSFTGYSPLDRDGPRLIGADNYTALLGDADFRHSLLVTGQFILAVLPPAVVLALGLALLANRPIRGIGALRAGLYIPHVVPLAAVSLVWLWLYSRNGWFDSLLADVGIAPKDWLLDEGSALPSVAVMRIWKALGGNMVLLLAGLQTIPRDLYEAVAVDGGGWLAKFRYVTLPGLRPVLVYVITLNFVYLVAVVRGDLHPDRRWPVAQHHHDEPADLPGSVREQPVRLGERDGVRAVRVRLRVLVRGTADDARSAMSARGLRRGGTATALVVATLLVLIPFGWMASVAFTPEDEVLGGSPSFIPAHPTMANFDAALGEGNIGTALLNSVIVALVVVVTNCVLATLAGYAFAKLSFPGSNALFLVLISTSMLPVAVTLIPQFLMVKGFPLAGGNDITGTGGSGLLDSLAGLTIPFLVGPLNIFLARQFFLGLPDELREAGLIDGAGEFGIFRRIYLPLAAPLVATIAVFSFTAVWDDFLWPLVIITSPEHQTAQLALSKFLTSGNIAFGPAMAGTVLVVLPVLTVFLFCQRSFVAGLSDGAVKG